MLREKKRFCVRQPPTPAAQGPLRWVLLVEQPSVMRRPFQVGQPQRLEPRDCLLSPTLLVSISALLILNFVLSQAPTFTHK